MVMMNGPHPFEAVTISTSSLAQYLRIAVVVGVQQH